MDVTEHKSDIALIRSSGLFDRAFYLRHYPDVATGTMDPASHYVTYGAAWGRDPGPGFSSDRYLQNNPDVAAHNLNPLVHYERYGRAEGRPAPPSLLAHQNAPKDRPLVDIVVPVFDALEDVKLCLTALPRVSKGLRQRVIVVNDGSGLATARWLRSAIADLATDTCQFDLIEHAENQGYTRAVNAGLAASTAPYVVTLNSDTIVTSGWLEAMIGCMQSDPQIGIVGPLSNAASWQNVPTLQAPDGTFAINPLPPHVTPDDMARLVRRAADGRYPRTPFLNGFCFMIRRATLTAVGMMDAQNFPIGYGEENDFCIRAKNAGFQLAIADTAYVYHAKSKSFGSERRAALSAAGKTALQEKHGFDRFEGLLAEVKRTAAMDEVRARVAAEVARARPQEAADLVIGQRILFLLPVRGGGGGVHSVVQEATAMRALGVDAQIAVREQDYFEYCGLYDDIPNVSDLFFGVRDATIVAAAQNFDVVVATIFTTVTWLKRIVDTCPWILPVYYAQDYEPWFFERDNPMWERAYASYTLVDGAVIMAKTHWIGQMITANHGVPVAKISPSIDHDVYHPRPRAHTGAGADRLVVTAMIRPKTPRRGAGRTMELLARLTETFGAGLDIRLFGCDPDSPEFKDLPQDSPLRTWAC